MHQESLEAAARMKGMTLLSFANEDEYVQTREVAELIADRDGLKLRVERDKSSIRAMFSFISLA